MNTDTRPLAFEWWNKLTSTDKHTLDNKYLAPNDTWNDLTIVKMYLAEHPQPLKEVVKDDSMEGEKIWRENNPEAAKWYDAFKAGNQDFIKLAEKSVEMLSFIDKLKATNDALVSALQDMVDNFSPVIDGRDEIKQDEILAKAKELLNNINNQ